MAGKFAGKRARSHDEVAEMNTSSAKASKRDENTASESDAFRRIATVKALFVKPRKGGKMVAVSEMQVPGPELGGKAMQGKPKIGSVCSHIVTAVGSIFQSADSMAQLSWIEDCNRQHLTPRQLLLSCCEDASALKVPLGSLRENINLEFEKHIPQLGPNFDFRGLKSGMLLRIGAGENNVLIRVTFACEPCGHVIDMMKTAPVVSSKVLNPPCLKTLSSPVGRRGMLAAVVRGGTLKEEDVVEILSSDSCSAGAARPCYEPLADSVKGRVAWLVPQIPSGKVLPFRELLQLVGAPCGYARALPAILKALRGATKEKGEDFFCHRVVDTNYGLLRQFLPEQKSLLEHEGVAVAEAKNAAAKSKGASNQNLVIKNGPECFLWKPTQEELFCKKIVDGKS